VTVTGNMHKIFDEIWLPGFSAMQVDRQTDRQTNRHTHHNTLHPSRG